MTICTDRAVYEVFPTAFEICARLTTNVHQRKKAATWQITHSVIHAKEEKMSLRRAQGHG